MIKYFYNYFTISFVFVVFVTFIIFVVFAICFLTGHFEYDFWGRKFQNERFLNTDLKSKIQTVFIWISNQQFLFLSQTDSLKNIKEVFSFELATSIGFFAEVTSPLMRSLRYHHNYMNDLR